ncbi:uncharacterized protein [Mobula birostris]|uniref:uncharacterized protein n=1 Tax=Mobula birostris TaxID=1983395 RepID=UPI003B28BB96
MYSFSQAQRRGCSEILESLNYSSLLGLKDTIASKINVWSKEDLIGVILSHSQSAEELLKRKKVLREEILKYLIKHGVTVSTSSDKQQLINKALMYWMMSEMNREPSTAETDVQVLYQKHKEELGQKLVKNTESIEVKPQTTTSTTLRELRQVRQAEEQKEKEEKAKRQEEHLQRQEQMPNPLQGAMAMELNINVNILQTQRRGCSEILESLSCDNLLGLQDIVVSGELTTDDLIRIILNHSQSAEELLRRRKVRREDILKYLIKQGFMLPPSSDKQQLITEALVYWSRSELYREPSTSEADLQILHPTQSISQAQRRGCSEILKSLSCDNLLGLKDTIVSGLTTVDLIDIILNHSQSAEELLKRKKVPRENILKYLIKHGVSVSTSSDKQQLITVVLEYWSTSEVNREPLIAEADLELRGQTVMEELERQLEQLRMQ